MSAISAIARKRRAVVCMSSNCARSASTAAGRSIPTQGSLRHRIRGPVNELQCTIRCAVDQGLGLFDVIEKPPPVGPDLFSDAVPVPGGLDKPLAVVLPESHHDVSERLTSRRRSAIRRIDHLHQLLGADASVASQSERSQQRRCSRATHCRPLTIAMDTKHAQLTQHCGSGRLVRPMRSFRHRVGRYDTLRRRYFAAAGSASRPETKGTPETT